MDGNRPMGTGAGAVGALGSLSNPAEALACLLWANDHALDAQNRADPAKCLGVMPYTQCEMVGGSFGEPALQKGDHIRGEKSSGVGVTCCRDGSGDRLSLGDHELHLSLVRGRDAQHRDRSLPNLELDGGARARLAVVFGEATQHRLTFGYRDVMWAIMTYKDEALYKVDGVKLSKAATNLQPIHN